MESCFENFKNISKAICACSGGVDSMVVAFLIKKHLPNCDLHIVIVNHNIREISYKESQEVENYLKKNGFKVQVLHWQHEEIKTAIEDKARKARQKLIFEYAIENQIYDIFFGHHADDLIENFFIKLEMQAGIFGLSSCAQEKIFRWNGFYFSLLKPLNFIYKSQIIEYANKHNIFFVEDEGNFGTYFKRSRIRSIMDNTLNFLEVRKDSIVNCLKNLNQEAKIISLRLEYIFTNIIKFDNSLGFFYGKEDIFLLSNLELQFCIKQIIFYFMEKCEVRRKELENAVLKLKNKQKFTLGGMLFFTSKDKVFFIKEPSRIKDETHYSVWDKRFKLENSPHKSISKLPKIIMKTIPALQGFKPIPFKILYD